MREATDYSVKVCRSIELLLGALVACCPTEEDKERFSADLAMSVIKTGRQEPTMRNTAIEVLKLYGSGECYFHAKNVFDD